jgi:hypothetical protein
MFKSDDYEAYGVTSSDLCESRCDEETVNTKKLLKADWNIIKETKDSQKIVIDFTQANEKEYSRCIASFKNANSCKGYQANGCRCRGKKLLLESPTVAPPPRSR